MVKISSSQLHSRNIINISIIFNNILQKEKSAIIVSHAKCRYYISSSLTQGSYPFLSSNCQNNNKARNKICPFTIGRISLALVSFKLSAGYIIVKYIIQHIYQRTTYHFCKVYQLTHPITLIQNAFHDNSSTAYPNLRSSSTIYPYFGSLPVPWK